MKKIVKIMVSIKVSERLAEVETFYDNGTIEIERYKNLFDGEGSFKTTIESVKDSLSEKCVDKKEKKEKITRKGCVSCYEVFDVEAMYTEDDSMHTCLDCMQKELRVIEEYKNSL